MDQKDYTMKKAFEALEQNALPTEAQKDAMLNNILQNCEAEQTSFYDRLKQMVSAYPWRFAFAASAVQAAALTLIFGTQYTNFFLGVFGG